MTARADAGSTDLRVLGGTARSPYLDDCHLLQPLPVELFQLQLLDIQQFRYLTTSKSQTTQSLNCRW